MAKPFSSESLRNNDISETVINLFDQFRSQVEKKTASRKSKGDVRAAILALLAEGPMHGYQIIHQIEERSGGAWKPSAGSIYPTLQMLADEGIVSAEELKGRKTYSLTEEGKAEAQTAGETPPWQHAHSFTNALRTELPKAGVELAQAAAQVNRMGTDAQIEEAVQVIDEARRKLYSILAQG